jgi:hypothetical protein
MLVQNIRSEEISSPSIKIFSTKASITLMSLLEWLMKILSFVTLIYYKFLFIFFFSMPPNDRGYGLGRAAGEFPVAIATKEKRAQRLPEAH